MCDHLSNKEILYLSRRFTSFDMAIPLTSMNLAKGKDPIDPVYAEASTSAHLDHGETSERRKAADSRAAARFS